MAMNMVGTPCTAVHFSEVRARITFIGENASIGTKEVPWVMHAMRASTMPKQ